MDEFDQLRHRVYLISPVQKWMVPVNICMRFEHIGLTPGPYIRCRFAKERFEFQHYYGEKIGHIISLNEEIPGYSLDPTAVLGRGSDR